MSGNPLGSVREFQHVGTVLDHVVYDSFGNIVTETNSANGDRFKFTGMQLTRVISQYYDDARWYSATRGTFISLDPMGFSAGGLNLYAYVTNDPSNAVDTTGLAASGGQTKEGESQVGRDSQDQSGQSQGPGGNQGADQIKDETGPTRAQLAAIKQAIEMYKSSMERYPRRNPEEAGDRNPRCPRKGKIHSCQFTVRIAIDEYRQTRSLLIRQRFLEV